MSSTSIRIGKETKSRLFRARGSMEVKDGKKRTVEDVINALIDFWEAKEV